jgi:hypothetical protein
MLGGMHRLSQLLSDAAAWAMFTIILLYPSLHLFIAYIEIFIRWKWIRMLAVLDPKQNVLVVFEVFDCFNSVGIRFFPPFRINDHLVSILARRYPMQRWHSYAGFWRTREERRAKELFWRSLVHLPLARYWLSYVRRGYGRGSRRE